MSGRGRESKKGEKKNPNKGTPIGSESGLDYPKLPYPVPVLDEQGQPMDDDNESCISLHRDFSMMRLADPNGPLSPRAVADATNGNFPSKSHEGGRAASPVTSLFWSSCNPSNPDFDTNESETHMGELCSESSGSDIALAHEVLDAPESGKSKDAQGSEVREKRSSRSTDGRKKADSESSSRDLSARPSRVLSERAIPASEPVAPETPEENLDDSCDYYAFTQEDVEKTSITNWYFKFSAVTQKTIFIPIPPAFLEYLNSPFCNLPKDTVTSVMPPFRGNSPTTTPMSSSYDSSTSMDFVKIKEPSRDADSSSDDEENCLIYKPMQTFDKFDDMDNRIEAAILELGGSVLPKLNWKSPKDAVWIGFNKSIRCYLPGDIYLLFKASEHITQALNEPYKGCKDFNGTAMPPTLVLREWHDISPAIEFRCFVVQRFLVGICQRDVSGCYPSIRDHRDMIISDIYDFYRKIMFKKVEMSYYVFDVIHCGKDDVKLVDLNVFGLVTDPLLFTYRELERMNAEVVVENETTLRHARPQPEDLGKLGDKLHAFVFGNPTFRFIERPGAICAHPYLSSGAPRDLRI